MKASKGFLAFILIVIIVGGLGYIGYSFLGMDHSNMANMFGSQTASSDQSTEKSNTASNSHQNMQGMEGMQQGNSNQNQHNSNNQQSTNNQIALNQANMILQNKEKLGKSTDALNKAMELLTVDPYAPSSSNTDNMSNMGQKNSDTSNTQAQPNTGNSTINIYPQNNNTVNVVPPTNNSSNTQTGMQMQNGVMQNMGTSYDANKMEQLHTGLYKISVGMALLNQLNDELVYQAEYASVNTQNPVQYYSNQYNLSVQNKDKLSKALNYINEAANLVNINPYVSTNGLVYDKDRMKQIHQSVFKLAEGVAALNQLSDDFTKQTILISNTVQNYINNGNNNLDSTQMNHSAMSTGLFGGLFDNVSLPSVVNVILIIFVAALIIGVFGFIFSLLKTPVQKTAKKEDAA